MITHAAFVKKLRRQHLVRNKRPKVKPRQALTAEQRKMVRDKTGSRCHLCGGKIRPGEEVFDHLLAHARGGKRDPANFLVAHAACNALRRDRGPDEFQFMLRIGMWARTQMEKQKPIGQDMVAEFLAYEQANIDRRRKKLAARKAGEPAPLRDAG